MYNQAHIIDHSDPQAVLKNYVAQTCSLEDIKEVETPVPTETWMPIPHIVCLEGCIKALSLESFEVESMELCLTPGFNKIPGERFFALLNLKGVIYEDYRAVCAIINTHDKYQSFKFAVGHSVFICTNLALSAEVVVTRKHTARVMQALPGLLWQCVQQIPFFLKQQDFAIAKYKQINFDTQQFDHYAMSLMRKDVVPVSKLSKLWDAYQEGKDNTLWGAFNACTSVLKDYNDPFRHNERTQRLHGVSDDWN